MIGDAASLPFLIVRSLTLALVSHTLSGHHLSSPRLRPLDQDGVDFEASLWCPLGAAQRLWRGCNVGLQVGLCP